jgi:hypothetical protein
MDRRPDIIASLRFLSTEEGGRKGPTPPGIFRCLLEFEGAKFDCGLHLEGTGPLAPGVAAVVPITLLFPALIKPRLKVGSRFELREIATIATGVVIEVSAD